LALHWLRNLAIGAGLQGSRDAKNQIGEFKRRLFFVFFIFSQVLWCRMPSVLLLAFVHVNTLVTGRWHWNFSTVLPSNCERMTSVQVQKSFRKMPFFSGKTHKEKLEEMENQKFSQDLKRASSILSKSWLASANIFLA